MKEAFQKQFDKDIQKFLKENKVFSVWNYSELDKDFDEVFKKLNPRSTVIDLGCGNGAQAYHIQKMGFDVTGTDVVNALEYKLNNFILDDALQSKLTKKYDVIVDRGLIHNLFHLKETRHKYFEMIGNITHDDSYIILKVLSPYEARFNPSTHSGPYRFNEKQLEGFYSGFGFKCVELRDTLFYTNLQPHLRGYLGIYKKEL
jgi:cyclopropane fatty-acyl-phospholipid synthase-like methyltransferase